VVQHGSLEAANKALLDTLLDTTHQEPNSVLKSQDSARYLQVLTSMVTSRALDTSARRLKPSGRVFYTIGSAGHEGNAVVASQLRNTDPALLHYRSGAFCANRLLSEKTDPVDFLFPSFLASSKDQVSGGRHRVLGGPGVIPQTSTIASHAPRALGLALALPRSKRLSLPQDRFPQDSVVLCSFGDASFNHSTLQGAINASSVASFQKIPAPIIFLCEDNGIGISTRSPSGFISSQMKSREGIDYIYLPSTDVVSWHDLLESSISKVRSEKKPLFIHASTVRLGGHAGTDVESAYRSSDEIKQDYKQDPILVYVNGLISSGVLERDFLINYVNEVFERVSLQCDNLVLDETHTTLASKSEVINPISKLSPHSLKKHASSLSTIPESSKPESSKPLTIAQSINHVLVSTLESVPQATVFGQDVGAKGGVYGVTKGLQKQFGRSRVFDSILDEQSILGYALGSSLLGALPIPEIQYLAYLHNAEDQLRGEASTLSFFSNRDYLNGTVVRVASYGYQKGFGGHFHNDNGVSVLRDIPGLIIASPSRPSDAAAMLSSCLAHARFDGAVCVFLEPIALYHTTDLFKPGDNLFAEPLPNLQTLPPVGSTRVYPAPNGSQGDIVLASWANGLYMSLRVQKTLESRGINASVVDMRFLAPLPTDELYSFAQDKPILVVDETRFSGGPGESIVANLVSLGHRNVTRIASADSFIPTGPASDLVLLQEQDILSRAIFVIENS
jgi:2-oxoisovalerate dehydrogenase E1 component